MPKTTQKNLRSHHKKQIKHFFKPTAYEKSPSITLDNNELMLKIKTKINNELSLLQQMFKLISKSKHPYITLLTFVLLSGALIVLMRNRSTVSNTQDLTHYTPNNFLKYPHQLFFTPIMQPQSIQSILKNEKKSRAQQTLLVQDITPHIMGCNRKTHGTSAGKICIIEGVTHYLKTAKTEDRSIDRRTNALLGLYNIKLIKYNMDIIVPEVAMVFEKDGSYITEDNKEIQASYYIASQEINNFTSIDVLLKKIHGQYSREQHKNPASTVTFETMKRQSVVHHIGETGIAKLAVAGTFFQDLIMNPGNWGYNDQGLVIIDVDHSPATLEAYLNEATHVPRNIELLFSLQTVRMMSDYYKEMLLKSPPIIHDKVNMSHEFYNQLLQLYLQACNKALIEIEEKYPELDEEFPTQIVNDLLAESFLHIMSFIRDKNIYSQYTRYDAEDLVVLLSHTIKFIEIGKYNPRSGLSPSPG